MPHSAAYPTPPSSSRASTASRSRRQYLKKGGIARDDSDDELGLEDHPWEWIYATTPPPITTTTDSAAPTSLTSTTKKKTRNASSSSSSSASSIVGARMGDFECRVGDCVLLKAEGNNEAWVGLICEFAQEEEEEAGSDGEEEEEEEEEGKGKGMVANFMWFSTDREIRNERKRRGGALPNELYITPSWDVNPLASINGKATVLSERAFLDRWPSGKVPKSSKDFGKVFVCRRGCSTRTATYTEEFVWEDVFAGAEDLPALIERVKGETKATRTKRKRSQLDEGDEGDEYVFRPDAADEPHTPRKRRKFAQPLTPQSKSKRTPGSRSKSSTQKRILVKKPLTITPLSTRFLSPSHTNSTPHQLARNNLHVASVPLSLPCRQTEFETVYTHLESAITAGSGSCIYISGTPGTGKTATVREVVAQLHASVQAEELDDFIFVEINGMKVPEPTQAYSLLWEALRGERVSPGHALGLLENEFAHPSPRRVPCVVLMDELDQLVTRTQSVMYNFFNWPGLRHSRLIVLAVANTMDLPERTLSNKISSRLGLTRILFPGYTHEQLMEIVRSRLAGVGGDLVDPDAVQFAARKVAAVSGDARRCLDICRRAVEIAEAQGLESEETRLLTTPSKKAKHRGVGGSSTQEAPKQKPKSSTVGKVTIQTIKTAITEATSSPMQQCLRSLPLAAKIFLAALLARTRRTGVNECLLSDVVAEAKRLAVMAVENPQVHETLLKSVQVYQRKSQDDDVFSTPSKAEAKSAVTPRIKGMGLAASELADAGVIGLERGRTKGERIGRVRLGVGDEEVSIALKGDAEVRGMGFG